jgi:uncharacterized protein YxeA
MKKCKSCQSEINDKAKKCPKCQADQRIWFAKHKILTGILIIILISIVANMGGSKNKTTNSNPTNNSNNQATETNKEKQYVKVIELSGTQNKKSDSFTLQGGKQKITYDFQGGDMIVGGIYVMKEGTSKDKDGGIPEVMIQNSGSDSTITRKGAGTYYLDITAANSKWTVTIEEER